MNTNFISLWPFGWFVHTPIGRKPARNAQKFGKMLPV